MGKQIQVSDDVFRRLQRLAEPLVDSTDQVIERLLDLHEAAQSKPADPPADSTVEKRPKAAGDPRRIFLVPATQENVDVSIARTVALSKTRHLLSDAQFESLRSKLSGDRFKCWAMTESKRATYEKMRVGDLVLLTLKGSGRFDYRGRVVAKIESERLGNSIWPIVPRKPWKLIYILDDVRSTSLNKRRLVTALGYDADYAVPGAVCAGPDRVRRLVSVHGSVEAGLQALGP